MAYEIRPRTDYHSLNADWILEEMHKAVDAWKTSETYWTSAKQAFDEMKESFQMTTDQFVVEWPIFKKNIEDAQQAFQNEMLGHYAEFTSDTLEEYDKFKTAQQNAYNSFVSTINEQWDTYKETMNAAFHDLTVTEAEARAKLEEDVHTYVQDWFKNLDVAETVKEETIAYLGSDEGKAFLSSIITEEVLSPIDARITALETKIANEEKLSNTFFICGLGTPDMYMSDAGDFVKLLPFPPTDVVVAETNGQANKYGIAINLNINHRYLFADWIFPQTRNTLLPTLITYLGQMPLNLIYNYIMQKAYSTVSQNLYIEMENNAYDIETVDVVWQEIESVKRLCIKLSLTVTPTSVIIVGGALNLYGKLVENISEMPPLTGTGCFISIDTSGEPTTETGIVSVTSVVTLIENLSIFLGPEPHPIDIFLYEI